MDIKFVRSIHLYLGCFFTPLFLFFLMTGLMQTFELHEQKKNGYKPPALLKAFSQVHQHQRYETDDFRPDRSRLFQIFVVVMTIGLLVNLAMGIILAFKFGHAAVVWISVILGLLVPCIILYLPWLQKSSG